MGQGKDEIAESPAEIRKAIARTRETLGTHLSALVNPESPAGGTGDETMAKAKSSAKRAATGSEKKTGGSVKKTAVKSKSSGKASSAKSSSAKASSAKASSAKSSGAKSSSRRTTKRVVKSTVAKAERVLDKMAAGAIVGAVEAAATVAEKQTKTPRSTGKVVSKLAPEAAAGAVVGAAKAVLSEGDDTSKGRGKGAKSAKGGSSKRK